MIIRILATFGLALLLAGCGNGGSDQPAEGEATVAAGDYERGPHNGRMLRDGDFAIEVTIFETGVPPQYRLYPFIDGQPVAPAQVQATVELHRLDGQVDRFAFKPEGDVLVGDGVVSEPHSFDVKVSANHGGQAHAWEYESYEGRVTIDPAIAADAGIEVETAGPALIRDTVQLSGRIAIDDSRHAQVKARFPGTVRAVRVQQGDRVRRGQALVVVEANQSMRSYTVTAPIDGVVLARNTNVGDFAGDTSTLVELADLSEVWVELQAIGKDAGRLSAGQPVEISAATGDMQAGTVIDTLLPLATLGQSVVARARLPNPDGRWRPGMSVIGEVTIAERRVPLAVKESGLQRFRDFTVVFAQIGPTYEVRMLDLGARDGEFVEVLGGLKPGTRYVTGQSFLIKADIEKSGASHDH